MVDDLNIGLPTFEVEVDPAQQKTIEDPTGQFSAVNNFPNRQPDIDVTVKMPAIEADRTLDQKLTSVSDMKHQGGGSLLTDTMGAAANLTKNVVDATKKVELEAPPAKVEPEPVIQKQYAQDHTVTLNDGPSGGMG